MSDSEGAGTLAEEAARLFGALAGLAREHGGGVQGGLGDLSHRAAAPGIDEHVATGAAECSYCPLCRVIHTVQETSPEVRAHLAVAASALVQAAAGLLATVVPTGPRSDADPGVEHIDLDGDVPVEDLDLDESDASS